MAKILIIEDEAEIREIERDYLQSAGFETAEVADGINALKIFEHENPDLVLLDLNLPGQDGLEICRALRAQSVNLLRLWLSFFRLVRRLTLK